MRNEIFVNYISQLPIVKQQKTIRQKKNGVHIQDTINKLPEILFITSYPPRECGIATYSQDLIIALNNKFNHSFRLHICALESENEKHNYTSEIKYILNTDHPDAFIKLAKTINENADIR